MPSPNLGKQENTLNRVAALNPSDAWATGMWSDTYNNGDYHAFVIHWDGTAWTPVTIPNLEAADHYYYLVGITALSDTDIWIVGNDAVGDDYNLETVALHWDGITWTQVPTVSPFTNSSLFEVSGTSSTDVWAVGGEDNYINDEVGTLIEHWNGTRWTHVPSPSPADARSAFLFDVTTLTPTDAWATGYWIDVDGVGHALVMHWDGTAWNLVTLPNLGAANSILASVAAFSRDDVWFLGSSGYTSNTAPWDPGTGAPLTLNWNGSTWTIVSTPSAAIPGGHLNDVIRVGDHELWGTGLVSNPGGRWNENETTLIQRLRLCPA